MVVSSQGKKEVTELWQVVCLIFHTYLEYVVQTVEKSEKRYQLSLFPKRYSSFRLKSQNCSFRHVLSQIYTSVPTHTHSWNCQCRCLPKTVDQDSVWANARWPSQVLSACELFLVLPLSLLLPNPSSRDRLLFLSGHRLRTSFHSKYGKDYLLKFCFPCHFISRSNRSCRMKHSHPQNCIIHRC